MTFAMLMAMLGISSCSKTDLYDEGKIAEREAAEAAVEHQKVVAEYEANFVKTYGAIDPNQSWDFSTGITYFSLPNSATRAITRAGSYTREDSKGFFKFPAATIQKLNTEFVEGENNTAKGYPFAMTVPGNAFYIMPMYMGTSGGNFNLWMHVDGIENDILVWRKWQDMEVKGETWWGGETDWTPVKDFDSSNNCKNATAIRSKYYKFSGLPTNAVMYFYLEITETADGYPYDYNKSGEKLASLNDYMRAYSFSTSDLPENLPNVSLENRQVMIIGCEDASNINMTDRDYNDVVFMIFGEPYVPQTFKVDEFETTYSKRYMIEDLGSTDDFDFNDIVVDVSETFTQKKTTDNYGVVTWSDPVLKGQKAIIRHLGGILPFELTIGSTALAKMDGVLGADPDTEFTITGWERDNNNISIKVYQSASDPSSNAVNNIAFPETGAIPMIISTDTNVDWAAERIKFDWQYYRSIANGTTE